MTGRDRGRAVNRRGRDGRRMSEAAPEAAGDEAGVRNGRGADQMSHRYLPGGAPGTGGDGAVRGRVVPPSALRGARRGVEDQDDGAGAIAQSGGEAAARRIALDALSRAARTRGQLEELLQRKGIAPEAAAAVLDRFEEVGLIDDIGYAQNFVESRHRVRGQGSRALSAELRRRGVADDVVSDAVGSLDPEQEFDTACRIARARYVRMPDLPGEVKVRRLAGFLARKGYSGAVVSRAVRQVIDAAESEAAEALDGMDADGDAAID